MVEKKQLLNYLLHVRILSYEISINNYFDFVASAADATPSITQPLADITIIEGRPLKLSCVIVGLQVTVNWFHNGKVILLNVPFNTTI